MSLLLTICALHFVAQLSPGPDVLLIARSSASTSRANTLKIILGISVGILVWVVLTLLGGGLAGKGVAATPTAMAMALILQQTAAGLTVTAPWSPAPWSRAGRCRARR